MIEKVLIYTHAVDLDGWTSGALIKLLHPLKNEYKNDIEYEFTIKTWTYSREEPDFKKLIGYDYFYLTDLHFSNELIAKLYNHYNDRFIWIDHHKKSIEDFYNEWPDVALKNNLYCPMLFNSIDTEINGIQSTDYAACGLVWKYFIDDIINNGNVQQFCQVFKEYKSPEKFNIESLKKFPKWLDLIDTYDKWNNSDSIKWSTEVMPFQFDMRTKIGSVENMLAYINKFEDDSLSMSPEKLINDQIIVGKQIYAYQQQMYRNQLKTGYPYLLNYNNNVYKAFILNTQDRGSIIFEPMKIRNDNYDIFIVWYYDGHNYNYSMYTFSDNINCAEICSHIGNGGGHKQAAGFKSDKLMF